MSPIVVLKGLRCAIVSTLKYWYHRATINEWQDALEMRCLFNTAESGGARGKRQGRRLRTEDCTQTVREIKGEKVALQLSVAPGMKNYGDDKQ